MTDRIYPAPDPLMRAFRRIRMARGLSQDEVCRQTGIARTYLSRIETGRNVPSLGVLQTLDAFYGLNLLPDRARIDRVVDKALRLTPAHPRPYRRRNADGRAAATP